MKNNKAEQNEKQKLEDLALYYMKILTDVAREPFLILDANLRVISANLLFYEIFQVLPKETEGKYLYNLGNGQWNIPKLKELLENILPNKKNVKNYEVSHIFQAIGEKTMSLNATQIDSMQLIILAIEDITERRDMERKKAGHTQNLEVQVQKRTQELGDKLGELEAINKTMVGRELKMVELKKEIQDLKKRVVKVCNGANGNEKRMETEKIKKLRNMK